MLGLLLAATAAWVRADWRAAPESAPRELSTPRITAEKSIAIYTAAPRRSLARACSISARLSRRHHVRDPAMRIAMVGTRGLPARYGGFETCVEEVGSRLAAAGHDVVVYCRVTEGDVPEAPTTYAGCASCTSRRCATVARDTEPHGAVGRTPLLARPTSRRCSTPRTRRSSRSCGPAHTGRHPRRRARVEAGQVGRAGPPLLPHGRVARGTLVRRAHRRRRRHQ